MAIFFLLSTLLLNANIICLLLFIAAAAGYYFARQNADIEYEYQYCDKVLDAGDTNLLPGELIEVQTFEKENNCLKFPLIKS